MTARSDLLNQEFDRLTVIKFSHVDKWGTTHWICQCDCGTMTTPIQGSKLTGGVTISCGCYQRQRASESNRKDLTNQSINNHKFLHYVRTDKGGHSVWLVECLLCGTQREARATKIKNGYTTSCGCRTISVLHEKTKQALVNIGIEIYQEEMPIHQSGFSFDNRNSILKVDLVVIVNGLLIAIECQGEQHYQPVKGWGGDEEYRKTVERDALKKACLKVMNIPLIEVRYDCPDIEEYIRKMLLL